MPRRRERVQGIILCLVILSLGACVAGPRRENDTALDYLDGHNYQAGDAAQGIYTVVKREDPSRTVSGTLQLKAGRIPIPLQNQTVVLFRGDREIARTMTDSQGAFILAGDIRNGSYSIRLDSEKYAASRSVEVTNYKTKGILLVVTK